MTSKQMHDVLVRLDQRTETIASDVDSLKHAIHGNGRPGLVDAATRLDERVKTLEERGGGLGKKEQAALWSGLIGAVVALAHVIERLVH